MEQETLHHALYLSRSYQCAYHLRSNEGNANMQGHAITSLPTVENIPGYTCHHTAERTFSALRRLKTYSGQQ